MAACSVNTAEMQNGLRKINLPQAILLDSMEFASHLVWVRGLFCIAAYRVVDLLAMHCHIAWSVNSNADFIASDFNDCDPNIVTNDDRFVDLP